MGLYDQLPWQQGLKHLNFPAIEVLCATLWPTSMTTRIETQQSNICKASKTSFMTNFHDNKDWNRDSILYVTDDDMLYDQLPWQQGLKHTDPIIKVESCRSLWPTSMTTRIETVKYFYCWEISCTLYDQLPWQQGLKHLNLNF